MHAKLGITTKSTPVIWDTSKLINGHILILGASGVGKSHTIRKVSRRALASAAESRRSVRFHVFDVHGDLDIPGASEVQFSESVTFGLNPLRVNPDPHFGGVRKCIQRFIRTINQSSRTALGVKQEAVISNLLEDTYREFDFEIDDAETWKVNGAQVRLAGGQLDNRLYLEIPFDQKDEAKAIGGGALRWDAKKGLWWCHTEKYTGELTRWKPAVRMREYPTVDAVLEYAHRIHLERFLGTDQKAIIALQLLNKQARKYQAKLLNAARWSNWNGGEIDVEMRAELEAARATASETYDAATRSIQTGHELNSLIRYQSVDVLKSVVDRLQNLKRTGIFKDTPPPFDRANPVWRYKVNALAQEEKKMFVLFTLQSIFSRAVQRGEVPDVIDVIVLDELGTYCGREDADEGDGIIGTIGREGRKFGIALWGAAQSPASVPESLVSSTGTKLLLGIDESYWQHAVTKLRVEKDLLEWVKPQVSCAIQLKERGNTRNRWLWTNLEDDTVETYRASRPRIVA